MVNLVRDDYDVVMVNLDPAMHDIQAYEMSHLGPGVLFNVPLPISERYPPQAGLNPHFSRYYEGESITQPGHMTKNRRVFVMQCGFHAYMESWELVEDHPYYGGADERERFTLTDSPTGSYEVVVWHSYLCQNTTKEVTIQSKESTSRDITITAPAGRLYAN